MSKEKQIEEMAREMCHLSVECKTCQICNESYDVDDEPCYFQCVAKEIINHGYRKQEWISVDERLPETKLETITVKDVESGTEEQFLAQVSELVAIVVNHPKGVYIDIDRTIDGAWSNNWFVTHWMPLPELPKMKGGAE